MSARADIAALADTLALLDRIAATDATVLAEVPELELTHAFILPLRDRAAKVQARIGCALDVRDRNRKVSAL